MNQEIIYRSYAIRMRKKTGKYDVLEPHSDFLIKKGGFVNVIDATQYIDQEITRIAQANEDEGEFD